MADPDAGHMQVLKYAYKTNFLSASEEAAAYEHDRITVDTF